MGAKAIPVMRVNNFGPVRTVDRPPAASSKNQPGQV